MTLNELFARFDKLASVSADNLPPPFSQQQNFEPYVTAQSVGFAVSMTKPT